MKEEIRVNILGSKGTLSLVDFQYLFATFGDQEAYQIDKEEVLQFQILTQNTLTYTQNLYNPAVKKLMDSKYVVASFLDAVENYSSSPEKWDLAGFEIGLQTQKVIEAVLTSNGKWVEMA